MHCAKLQYGVAMTDQSAEDMQRQLAVLNRMYRNFDVGNESDYVDTIRRDLAAEGLIVRQCPHWCERMEVLCGCVMDAKPANECIVAGVTPGDFVTNPKALQKFADVV